MTYSSLFIYLWMKTVQCVFWKASSDSLKTVVKIYRCGLQLLLLYGLESRLTFHCEDGHGGAPHFCCQISDI